MKDFFRRPSVVLSIFLLVSALYCAAKIRQSWIPQDEGVLAQLAERTLQGQFPHRDFDEPYTGGLSWLNALAFHVFGARLIVLRIPLFFGYLFFLAAFFALARRWLTPWTAALFGWTCVGWGLPAYPAALPSWYLMFFAGFGTLALMTYLETERMRWLFLAGLMGGLAMCIKILGAYFVLAGSTWLLYRSASAIPKAVKGVLATSILLFVTGILWKLLGVKEFVIFLLPVAFVLRLTLSSGAPAAMLTFRKALFSALIFCAGVGLPLSAYALLFWRAHALRELAIGLFILPLQRYRFAYYPLPSLRSMLCVIPVALLFWRSLRQRDHAPHWLTPLGMAAALILALGGVFPILYHAVWFSLRPLTLVLAITGSVSITRLQTQRPLESQRLALVVMVMAFMSLIQFPDSFGIYFFYTAPFIALAAMALFQSTALRLRPLGKTVLWAYGLFGFLWVGRGEPVLAGERFVARHNPRILLPERAGLQVHGADAAVYETLVHTINAHAQGNAWIYAGPDCPEVYFLSEKKNPTRYFYDFFSPQQSSIQAVVKAIQDHHVAVVVLNARPGFSPRVSRDFYFTIVRLFPHYVDIDNFRVFW